MQTNQSGSALARDCAPLFFAGLLLVAGCVLELMRMFANSQITIAKGNKDNEQQQQ
jgi:hypothetical protein